MSGATLIGAFFFQNESLPTGLELLFAFPGRLRSSRSSAFDGQPTHHEAHEKSWVLLFALPPDRIFLWRQRKTFNPYYLKKGNVNG